MKRTSQTHPLFINDLAVGPGRIGLTICPGKKGASVYGAAWDRDLDTDLKAIHAWGPEVVVTLVEADELEMLGAAGLGEAVQNNGMAWVHFPVRDLNVPAEDHLHHWREISLRLHRILDQGGNVLIHSRGGLGRAGTLGALLLIERGDTADEAISRIRDARPGAIETKVQEQFLRERASLPDRRSEMIRASLFGGAIGDALGAEIEFWKLSRIRSRFPNGVDEMLPHDGRIGAITDDTQMTLFTAEGLIRAAVRSAVKGICHPPSIIHHALLRWFVTQGTVPNLEIDDSGLVQDPRLHRRRAPGMTCLSALGAASNFGSSARNDSKGCGTIMRVAPVGLMAETNAEQIAMESSALTHGHKTGQEAAAAWALILQSVLRGAPPEHAARDLTGRFGPETDRSLRAALDAPRDGTPETVENLGGGWIAEEALAVALYAALASSSFEEGLRIAVEHSGDSDSTGAVAGNLLGLMYPGEVMAHPWRRQIECADLIDQIARDLDICARQLGRGQFSAESGLADRYPGW
ncbi:ADP-ribosylglycohydrolase family protein [Leisingera aquaemixtae]|uniref:ADP-ribosylglycohydrolase family protein n=1 Tax=Leisingera aquaemixtae TaxID=1396826 RepID=A0ABY5WEN8_9RHOB|nr:ADP-ribosylglycohydrolase family protein [Leisingera aquaemixtae]UWQ39920.1 ADP-ribosylglycohydrolase family protein [Leisingera aquaemixtae]